jgi:lysophospholipase L1-like esterase
MKIFIYSSQFFLIAAALLLFFTQCDQHIERKHEYEAPPISFIALGDSYTIGTGIQPENSWPYQLQDSLLNLGFSFDTTEIIATNGWTTTDLLAAIKNRDDSSTFNLVGVLIGVNNQYQNLDLDIYRTEFREIIEEAINFADGDTNKVFILSIPNYGVTPFGQNRNPVIIKQELEVYNDIANTIGSEFNIPFINITQISELAANDSSLLARDNLHPSAKMYALWVGEMVPTITQILYKHE